MLAFLWDEVELPHQLSRADIEGLHDAWRIVAIDEAVPHAVADDDEILVDDGRRGLCVMQTIGSPRQVLGQIDLAPVPEAGDRLAGGRVECNQPPAAVHEDAPLAWSRPHRHTAMHVARAVGHLSPVRCAWVEVPDLLAALGVERDDAVVGRAQVHHVVEHERSHLECAGTHGLATVMDRVFESQRDGQVDSQTHGRR